MLRRQILFVVGYLLLGCAFAAWARTTKGFREQIAIAREHPGARVRFTADEVESFLERFAFVVNAFMWPFVFVWVAYARIACEALYWSSHTKHALECARIYFPPFGSGPRDRARYVAIVLTMLVLSRVRSLPIAGTRFGRLVHAVGNVDASGTIVGLKTFRLAATIRIRRYWRIQEQYQSRWFAVRVWLWSRLISVRLFVGRLVVRLHVLVSPSTFRGGFCRYCGRATNMRDVTLPGGSVERAVCSRAPCLDQFCASYAACHPVEAAVPFPKEVA